MVCLFVSKNQFIIRDNKSIDVYSQFPVNYLKQYFYEIWHMDITCSLDNMVFFLSNSLFMTISVNATCGGEPPSIHSFSLSSVRGPCLHPVIPASL